MSWNYDGSQFCSMQKDKFLKIITMQINDFYISLASNGAATPLGEIDQVRRYTESLYYHGKSLF